MAALSTGRVSQDAPLQQLPTHVITGFLGAGKTTLIRKLIAQKPEHEKWAILVNEFGRIGIDQALFAERDDVVIKGLPGGCLCCQLAIPLQAGLVNLLHRARPDRLLIEPSGLGHPAGLLDVLHGDAFRDVLDIRGIIALVDARAIDDQRTFNHDTFRDQLVMADGIAINKTDLASTDQLVRMHHYLDALWPAKRWVRDVQQGEIPLDLLLNVPPGHDMTPVPRHVAHAHHHGDSTVLVEPDPAPGLPVREQAHALGYDTLGWCWHAHDRFDLDRLSHWLDVLPAGLRVKGVFHTSQGWYGYNRSATSSDWMPSSWRKDSRLELIGNALPPGDAMEHALRECLLPTAAAQDMAD